MTYPRSIKTNISFVIPKGHTLCYPKNIFSVISGSFVCHLKWVSCTSSPNECGILSQMVPLHIAPSESIVCHLKKVCCNVILHECCRSTQKAKRMCCLLTQKGMLFIIPKEGHMLCNSKCSVNGPISYPKRPIIYSETSKGPPHGTTESGLIWQVIFHWRYKCIEM